MFCKNIIHMKGGQLAELQIYISLHVIYISLRSNKYNYSISNIEAEKCIGSVVNSKRKKLIYIVIRETEVNFSKCWLWITNEYTSVMFRGKNGMEESSIVFVNMEGSKLKMEINNEVSWQGAEYQWYNFLEWCPNLSELYVNVESISKTLGSCESYIIIKM